MELNYSFNDMYPNYNFGLSTRTQTVADPEDQTALVDDQELARRNPVGVSPETHRGLWIFFAVVLAFIVFTNVKF